jgi:hypothetical protein
MQKEELIRREQEAILRLRSRGYGHLEGCLRKMVSLTLASRFQMQHLLAVGGHGVLFVAQDREKPADPQVVIKFVFMDWSRPGKHTVRELNQKREALQREGELLARGRGDVLPALVDSFSEVNLLIVEPEPRLAPGERFVAMELIEGQPTDVAARAAARGYGRNSPELDSWVSCTLQSIGEALNRLSAQFPELTYTDVAPKNFIVSGADTIRVVDAGALVPRGMALCQAPFTPEYCPLTEAERQVPADEPAIVRRLAVLGLDLLSDRISLGVPPEVVLVETREEGMSRLTEVLAQALYGEVSSLRDFVQLLKTAGSG